MDNPVQIMRQNTQEDKHGGALQLTPVITTLQIKGHHVPQSNAAAPYNQGRRPRQASLERLLPAAVAASLPPTMMAWYGKQANRSVT